MKAQMDSGLIDFHCNENGELLQLKIDIIMEMSASDVTIYCEDLFI